MSKTHDDGFLHPPTETVAPEPPRREAMAVPPALSSDLQSRLDEIARQDVSPSGPALAA